MEVNRAARHRIQTGQQIGQRFKFRLHRRKGRRPRKNLEGQLCQGPQSPETANEQFGEIESRRILDHGAPAPDLLPPPIDKANANQEIADAAVTIAPGTAQARGHSAAQRRPAIRQRRIEWQVLPLPVQHCRDLGDCRAGTRSKRVFLRLIVHNALQAGQVEQLGVVGAPALRERRLGASAPHPYPLRFLHCILNFRYLIHCPGFLQDRFPPDRRPTLTYCVPVCVAITADYQASRRPSPRTPAWTPYLAVMR